MYRVWWLPKVWGLFVVAPFCKDAGRLGFILGTSASRSHRLGLLPEVGRGVLQICTFPLGMRCIHEAVWIQVLGLRVKADTVMAQMREAP